MKKFLFIIVSLLSFSWALAQVNINTATAQELQTLNGIGPSKAAAIVEYRNANGPFKSPEDIKNVRGIGNGIYQKISSEITVGNGQATRTPAPRRAQLLNSNSRNRPPLNLLLQQPNRLPTNLQLLVLPPQNRLLPTPN